MRVKILVVFFAFIIYAFLFPGKIQADEKFDISTTATYQVSDNGNTKVSQVISIKNKTEFTYTPTYLITSAFKDIKNLSVFNSSGLIPNILKENASGQKSIEINFKDRVVGLDKVNQFTVEFDTQEVAIEKGSIWEVSIPGISSPNDFVQYDIVLRVPQNFGNPSIIKPLTNLSTAPYRFNKNQINKAGIYILFGDVQYYELNLSYHIENTNVVPIKTELALPPNTSYQEVRINSLSPAPIDVYEDSDGNWLAVYELLSKEKMTITAKVLVKVYSKPTLDENISGSFLSSQKYWEAEDPEIVKLARELKTPEAIYEFVVEKLKYNYDKVADNNVRLGARQALGRPDFSVCLEFTDLFIALARAAGIPARSVEGYAYTDDSKLRPLSLVKDVLHSWPEYYDAQTNKWVMVDPTWGNTTNGVDYFNTFDFDHIVFVVKGENSTYPIPAGGYKANGNTKDVEVKLTTQDEFTDITKSNVEANFPEKALSGLPVKGEVVVFNGGNIPLYSKVVKIESDFEPQIMEFKVEKILPYGRIAIPIEFSKTDFLTKKDYTVKIHFDGTTISKRVSVGLFPDYFLLVAGGVIIIGSITVAWASYKTWGLFIQKRAK